MLLVVSQEAIIEWLINRDVNMLTVNRIFCLATLSLIAFSGCAHHQLRFQTVKQANTLSDLYEQQVLDNLAMFATNPHAIPFFAFPNEGGTNVSGGSGIAGKEPLNPFFANIAFSTGRNFEEAWVLTPVRDASKLRLMQQAYQSALGIAHDPCHDFCADLNSFRGTQNDPCNGPCVINCGWLCKSTRKHDVPSTCGKRVGKYCGCYVWVKPGCEVEFSRLTLLILELAVNDPSAATKAKKKVMFYIDEIGNITNPNVAVGTVEATIDLDASVGSVLSQDGNSAQMEMVTPRPSESSESSGFLRLQNKQNVLPFLRSK